MRFARPTKPAGPRLTGAGGRFSAGIIARGESRKLFVQSLGVAVGARSSFPIGRADEYFAVLTAFFTMEFVNRHRQILAQGQLQFNLCSSCLADAGRTNRQRYSCPYPSPANH